MKCTHRRGSFEPLLGGFLQLSSTESSKLLVEELESLLADAVSALPGHDDVEEDAWQELDPDGEVIHARAAPAQPRPHVQPVLESDAGDYDLAMVWSQSLYTTLYASGDLVWPQGLLPGHVLPDRSPFHGDLLQHALQECSVTKP